MRGPIGDKVGPDSQAFSFPNVPLKKGQLLRLVIDPNQWWGTDMTRIGNLTIRSAKWGGCNSPPRLDFRP